MSEWSGWEELDHPADILLRIRGRSLQDLLLNAARGLIETIVAPDSVDPSTCMDVEVEGYDAESLLVRWLEEIHFRFDADGFVPADVKVVELTDTSVRGVISGEQLDRSRHELRNDIKAVTWHQLEIVEKEDGFEVTILFDL
jgi:SHS2 domain-containing protein